MGGGSGDSGTCEGGRRSLAGNVKSEAVRAPSPSGSQTPTGPSHPFYHGETEALERGRDLPKVIIIAGLNSTISHCHTHPIPAEISDMM